MLNNISYVCAQCKNNEGEYQVNIVIQKIGENDPDFALGAPICRRCIYTYINTNILWLNKKI